MLGLQNFHRPHFCFNPGDGKSRAFAEHLMRDTGSFSAEDCDIIVSVGGDGTLLYALRHLPDKPHFAVKAPESNSTLYHGHHNIHSGIELMTAFNAAGAIEIRPLKAQIKMSEGTIKAIAAYADIILHPFSASALLTQIGISEASKTRLMSGGLIVASPLGSTARNRSVGGEIIKLSDRKIVVTSDGRPLEDPDSFFKAGVLKNSVVLTDTTVVDIEISGANNKRPAKVLFDSSMILPDGTEFAGFPTIIGNNRFMTGMSVSVDSSYAKQMLRNQEYTTQPF